MLQQLYGHSKGWFIKGLFIALAASFVMWGIGDMFRNYGSMRPIATVGSHSITPEEFGGRLQLMTNRAQEAAKGRLTLEQIKEIGLAQKVLDSLIDQSVIAEELTKRRLIITDAVIRRHIQSIPAFLNEQGHFDKRAFDYLLQNNHISEAKFIADVRSELEQSQLFGALGAGMHLPKSYIDLLFRSFFEQRVFVVVTVPFAKMIVKDTPKQEELEKFYQQHKEQFTIPEMRKITLLEIDPKALSTQIEISAEQIQEEYDRRKAEFEIAERREVRQINFKDEGIAQKAMESLKKGRPMAAVARDWGGEFKDLGIVAKQQLPDLVADRLFESELGQILGPIETPFGQQIYLVSKIEPGYVKSFEDMRPQLESEIKIQIANDKIYELKNKVEDMLAAGSTLAEIAKEHHFKIQFIDGLSQSGKNSHGKVILPEMGRDQILEQAFTLTEGADSPVLDTKEGASYVVHLDAIKAAYVPDFADVQEKVADAWLENKRFDLSAVVAQQLAKDARSVADLTRMAASRKLPVKILKPLSRIDSEKDDLIHKKFSPQLVTQMFSSKANKAVIGVTPYRVGGGIQVVMLQKIMPFDPKSLKEKQTQMEKSLADLAFKDMVALYVANLRSQTKVSINKDAYHAMVERG
jgi:peptidyl-prolyl cis-trans isomerase D